MTSARVRARTRTRDPSTVASAQVDSDPSPEATDSLERSSDPAFPVPDWDRFESIRYLDAWGMGRVYSAFDPRLERPVALKVLTGEHDSSLVEEARAQARIEHDKVCRIYEVGEVQGRPYIAMQFIDGRDLMEVRPHVNLQQQVMLMRDVTRGVHEAHRVGLIHRDLEPGNVMVEQVDGVWKPYVLDFGLARPISDDAATTLSVSGTPRYMAPEQVRGPVHLLDCRTDVYSLGATFYELLSGVKIHDVGSPADVLVQVVSADVRPLREAAPSVPVDLETIVMKCLERDPARRYASARALADDLQRYMDGDAIRARRSSIGYRLSKRVHKLVAVTTAVALVAIFVLGAMWWMDARRAEREAVLAQQFGQEVERIESEMRYERMLALHDIRRVRERVRAQLETLSERVANEGAAAGPGHYALGRGYLILGDYDQARAHLDKAWGLGQQSPDAAYALGRMLAQLYSRACARAGALPDRAARDLRRAQIIGSYREPALRFLRAALGPGRPLAAALLAYHEGRLDEAAQSAAKAFATAPWLFEAKRSEGDVRAARASDARDSGKYEQAGVDYRAAHDAYEQAVAAAPSDPTVRGQHCRMLVGALFMDIHLTRDDRRPRYQHVRTACTAGITADPESAGNHAEAARAYKMWAQHLMAKDLDPRDALGKAAAAGRSALQISPDDSFARNGLGNVYRIRGEWELAHDHDPSASLEQAVMWLASAAELRPGLPYFWNNLGNAHRARAQAAFAAGGDPRGGLDRAQAAYQYAISLDPDHPSPHFNWGASLLLRARYQRSLGRDSSATLALAETRVTRGLEISPGNPYGRVQMDALRALQKSAAELP